jgi:hypothetical protein
MIIVEGLGALNLANSANRGFTPLLRFLNSKNRFAWENFVSNAGRTFGALPYFLGSLPAWRKRISRINWVAL